MAGPYQQTDQNWGPYPKNAQGWGPFPDNGTVRGPYPIGECIGPYPGNVLGYSVAAYLGAWLIDEPVQDDGTILDERSGLGDRRTMQPKRAMSFTGTDWGEASAPTLSYPFTMTAVVGGGVAANKYAVSIYSTSSKYIDFRTNGSGDLTVERRDSSSYLTVIGPNAASGFKRILVTFHSATAFDTWIDGEKTAHTGLVSHALGTPSKIYIGDFRAGNGGSWIGKIGQVDIYDGALTDSVIESIFAEKGPIGDLFHCSGDQNNHQFAVEPNGNNITWANAPATYEGQDVPTNRQNEVGYSTRANYITNARVSGDVISLKIKTTDTKVVLVHGSGTQDYAIVAEQGVATSGLRDAVQIKVDGVILSTTTRDAIYNAICDGVEHTIEITMGSNYISWAGITRLGQYTGFELDQSSYIRDVKVNGVAATGPLFYIPAKNATTDAINNPLQYKGVNPQDGFCSDHGCLVLDGTQYVPGDIISGSITSFKTSFWFKRDVTTSGTLISVQDSLLDGIHVYFTGNVYARINSTSINTTAGYADGQWHFADIEWNGTTLTIDIDYGGEVVSTSVGGAVNVTTAWRLGSKSYAVNDVFIGSLSNLSFTANGTERFRFNCAETFGKHIFDLVTEQWYGIANPGSNWGTVPGNFGRHCNAIDGFSRNFVGTNEASKDLEQILTSGQCAALTDTTIQFTVYAPNEDKVILFGKNGSALPWFGIAEAGSTNTTIINLNAGFPSMFIDDIEFVNGVNTRDDVATALFDGAEHVVRIENANLSQFTTGLYFQGYPGNGYDQFDGIVKDLTIGGVAYFSQRKVPAAIAADGTDGLGQPLTNPGGAWDNGSESKFNFTKEPKSLPVGATVPGDGTTAAYGTDPGDVVIGVTNGERKSRFYLEK